MFTVTEQAKLVRIIMATKQLSKQEQREYCQKIRHLGKVK